MGESETPPFELFNNKLVEESVKLISWCPTADLVLLVSTNDTASLYRNGFKVNKIWSFKNDTDSEIEAIVWKPNGKEFAIGYKDGSVLKVDTVNHTPKVSPCWSPPADSTPSSITSLVWINYAFKRKQMDIDGFDTDAFDLESDLPLLSGDPPEEPVSIVPIPASRRKKVQLPSQPLEDAEVQTLLFIGNSLGQISIILNGIYPIGLIDLADKQQVPKILDISVQQNVSSLRLLTNDPNTNTPNGFIVHHVNTQILEDRKEEIFSISEIQTKLHFLLTYTQVTIDVLKRHHASYAKLISDVARKASYYILQHNEQASAMPEVELTGTLAIGRVTETLKEFFSEFLTTQYIKTWEQNVTHGFENSLRVICEHILPACDRIQLQFSKLLGCSLWTERYGDFLETDAVKKCISYIDQLILQIHLHTKDINSLKTTFQAFTKWITVVSQKVSDPNSVEFQNESSLCENPDLVLKFLNTDFLQDSLARYFVSPNVDQDVNKSLVDLFKKSEISCREMLEKPSRTISKQIAVRSKSTFRLDGVLLEEQPRNTVVSITTNVLSSGSQKIYYAFVITNPHYKLVVMKSKFKYDSVPEYTMFDIPNHHIITDLEFFDDEELGICIQEDEDTTSLSTLKLEELVFEAFADRNLSEFKADKSLELPNMINVKLGCNGHPRRRIFCVVGSNEFMQIYSMDEPPDLDE